MTKSRKVVLFVVEGPSDELALGLLLSKLYRPSRDVRFEIVHGDKLAEYRVSSVPRGRSEPERPSERVRKMILDFIAKPSTHLKWNDLAEVIQITDTDAAFVPAESVVEEDPLKRKRLLERNGAKRRAATDLCCKDRLTYKGVAVPYAICYFSQNLEHALHGVERSLSDKEKEVYARQLHNRFRDDIAGFLTLLESLVPTGVVDYKTSWTYILEGNHSKERASNLRLKLPGGIQGNAYAEG